MSHEDELGDLAQVDAVLALAYLADRAGARAFEIGYNGTDDAPQWWASVHYRGLRVQTEGHPQPSGAADALARKLLTGARCRCGKLVALSPFGALAHVVAPMVDGTRWTAAEAAQAGQCLWKRQEARWASGCDAPPVPYSGRL
jgi:hypothetical protein